VPAQLGTRIHGGGVKARGVPELELRIWRAVGIWLIQHHAKGNYYKPTDG
jgi:hypothetical protein